MSLRKLAGVCSLIVFVSAQTCLAKDAPLLSLSAEHFRDTATVKDDAIAGVTTVATENGFVERHGLLGAVWNDEYLTGTIDRKTGRRAFEVITTLTYRGTRRAYGSAKYQQANGPSAAAPARLTKTSAVSCPTGECTYTDRVSFAVEEDLLRALAARAVEGKPEMWHYALIARSGGDYAGQFSNAEIAGFLAKVDEYTGAAPPPVAHPAAAAKPELGIGGLRVDASAQFPERSGVLITAVNHGSAAEKAGIIVGDIVREIDGHLVKTTSDLQAAIASSSTDATVTLKLYRGTAEMTVTAQP